MPGNDEDMFSVLNSSLLIFGAFYLNDPLWMACAFTVHLLCHDDRMATASANS
jgi:hypothetical protein